MFSSISIKHFKINTKAILIIWKLSKWKKQKQRKIWKKKVFLDFENRTDEQFHYFHPAKKKNTILFGYYASVILGRSKAAKSIRSHNAEKIKRHHVNLKRKRVETRLTWTAGDEPGVDNDVALIRSPSGDSMSIRNRQNPNSFSPHCITSSLQKRIISL